MRKYISIIFALAVVATACEKRFELDLPLAVSTHTVNLKSAAGSTHVLVYSTGRWTAKFTEEVEWASLNKQEGEGNNDFVFTYSENYSIARKVGVILTTDEKCDTINFIQAGAITEPQLSFKTSSIPLTASASDVAVAVTTNLLYSIDKVESEVSFEDSLTVDPWLTDVAVTAKQLTFKVKANTAGEIRTGYINIKVTDVSGKYTDFKTKLTVVQTMEEPKLVLSESSSVIKGNAAECLVPASENNIWPYADKITYTLTGVPEDDPWISKMTLTQDGLSFKVTDNESGVARSGKITLAYTDASGKAITADYSVSQKVYPTIVSFEDIRALPVGVNKLTDKLLNGYVVSDYTSKNICQSPQTGQFKFDFTENGKTAYVESKDGKYGFCLKFDTEDAFQAARYSEVKIALDSIFIVKNESPEFYTLRGFTAESVVEVKTVSEFNIPVKTRKPNEITDTDIFTLVSVPNLEILSKDGCFTNCTDGYSYKCPANPYSGATSPRWDVAPLMMSDMEGNTISMLTNGSVTWRRGLVKAQYDLKWGSVVPQGSGTFKGVVVAEDLVRYNMESVGKYQLRAMTKEDIALDKPAFSKTIVEWNWNDRVTDIIPEIGEGTLSGCGTTAAASDFNNCFNGSSGDGGNGGSTSNQKGLATNAALKLSNSWWDFTNDVGKSIDVSFSTKGVSGSNMIFGIVWGHGAMGDTTLDSPAHWNLLYSVDDGATFTKVEGNLVKNRSIVWWTTTSQDATPGFQEYIRRLPSECFGKDKVIVRLQVADKVTDKAPGTSASTWQTNLGIEKGTLTNKTTELRVGTITVRYN